jgi:hypothetical protein
VSGYLRRLAARSLGTADVARPIIPPLYSDWRREPSIASDGEPSGGALDVEEVAEAPPAHLPAVRSSRQPLPRDGDEPDRRPSPSATPRMVAVVPPSDAPAGTTPPIAATHPERRPVAGSRAALPTPIPRREVENAEPLPQAPARRATPPPLTVSAAADMPPPRPMPPARDRAHESSGSMTRPSDRPRAAGAHPPVPDRPALLALSSPVIEAPPAGARHARSGSNASAPRVQPPTVPVVEERTVEITIGRIEIRALPGAAPVAIPVAPRRPTLSLDAYLHARTREGRT